MKKNINAIIFAIAIISAAAVIGNAYKNRNQTNASIAVTGLGKTNFTSDLIVWEANFSKENIDLKQAYTDLETDKKSILDYLSSRGIAPKNIIFSAVSTANKTKTKYSDKGEYTGEEFIGYKLSQKVQIQSKAVTKVEKISREITELLHQGVQLYSSAPRYYYTKLADLKIEMISKATENARIRAEQIAENSGAALGDLKVAKMGIFQITGQYSGEDYSWGGSYNTASKEKTASITMKLNYTVK